MLILKKINNTCDIDKVKIVQGNSYSIYVYPEDHSPPHCHVRYKDNRAESVVGLPLFNLITGTPISKSVQNSLLNNLSELTKAWDKLNSNS